MKYILNLTVGWINIFLFTFSIRVEKIDFKNVNFTIVISVDRVRSEPMGEMARMEEQSQNKPRHSRVFRGRGVTQSQR